jgi:hypothetical protein
MSAIISVIEQDSSYFKDNPRNPTSLFVGETFTPEMERIKEVDETLSCVESWF